MSDNELHKQPASEDSVKAETTAAVDMTTEVPAAVEKPKEEQVVLDNAGNKHGKKNVTRRRVLEMAGCGVAGLIIGGALAKWGVIEDSIESGRISIRTTPLKMIITDRARCTGCQRCEMMCTLKNDGRVCQHIARVHVWQNYQYGASPDTDDGIYNNCQFTIESCKQCDDPWCMKYCPVDAITSDEKSGARIVDTTKCIGCGMCHMACPWHMPVIDTEQNVSTKCISCGRCADQCPNGAIKFIGWQDIADEVIAKGIVSTVDAVDMSTVTYAKSE
jgi:Fe-S-cluster-containing dehydrogenase component